MKTKKELGIRIKIVRQRLKMNQVQFAREIGVTNTAISSYETGDAYPSIPCLARIVTLGSVSYDWLLAGVESKGSKADDEGKLLRLFRQVGTDDQKVILKVVENAALVSSLETKEGG